jgi:hypothetical protein
VLAANTLLLLQKKYKKLQKLGCFSKQKYFLLSLKHPSFYSFSEEEEEECWRSVSRVLAACHRIAIG